MQGKNGKVQYFIPNFQSNLTLSKKGTRFPQIQMSGLLKWFETLPDL